MDNEFFVFSFDNGRKTLLETCTEKITEHGVIPE